MTMEDKSNKSGFFTNRSVSFSNIILTSKQTPILSKYNVPVTDNIYVVSDQELIQKKKATKMLIRSVTLKEQRINLNNIGETFEKIRKKTTLPHIKIILSGKNNSERSKSLDNNKGKMLVNELWSSKYLMSIGKKSGLIKNKLKIEAQKRQPHEKRFNDVSNFYKLTHKKNIVNNQLAEFQEQDKLSPNNTTLTHSQVFLRTFSSSFLPLATHTNRMNTRSESIMKECQTLQTEVSELKNEIKDTHRLNNLSKFSTTKKTMSIAELKRFFPLKNSKQC